MEKLSKFTYFIIVKVSVPGREVLCEGINLAFFILPLFVFGFPGLVLLKAFGSFYRYFTTDLGRDAFELSIPIWQVLKFVI